MPSTGLISSYNYRRCFVNTTVIAYVVITKHICFFSNACQFQAIFTACNKVNVDNAMQECENLITVSKNGLTKRLR